MTHITETTNNRLRSPMWAVDAGLAVRRTCLHVVLGIGSGCVPAPAAVETGAVPATPRSSAREPTPSNETVVANVSSPRQLQPLPPPPPSASSPSVAAAALAAPARRCAKPEPVAIGTQEDAVGMACDHAFPLLSPGGQIFVTAHTRTIARWGCHVTERDEVLFWRFSVPRGQRVGFQDVTDYEILDCVQPGNVLELRGGQRLTVDRLPVEPDGYAQLYRVAVRDGTGATIASATCGSNVFAGIRVCPSRVHRKLLVICDTFQGGDCQSSVDPDYRMFEY